MTDLPPTTPPPAGTQTPRTDRLKDSVIDAFSRYHRGEIYMEDFAAFVKMAFNDAAHVERELAAAIKERDEALERVKVEQSCLAKELAQLSATRKELEEARGALEVERGWVKSLAKDNGILLQAADATKQGSVCVSQAGRIEFLEEQLAKCTVSVLPKGHMQLSHRLYLRAYQVLCQARVMFEASLILQDDRDNMKAIRVMSDSAKAVLDELPNPVTPPLKGETKPAE